MGREQIEDQVGYFSVGSSIGRSKGAKGAPTPENAKLFMAMYEAAVIVHNEALKKWTDTAIQNALSDTRERAAKKKRNHKRAIARFMARARRRRAASVAMTDGAGQTAAGLDDVPAGAVKSPAVGDIWTAIQSVSKGR